MNNDTILVSVCMITFNHESYIAQAIEGILIQKTDFPIELVIGEDCSTDRTREICKVFKENHPDLIKLRLPEKNMGVMPNLIENLNACNGKYIAICEGDDYWTDPYKLQKQVDFLESHTEYSLCFHANQCLYSDGTFIEIHRYKEDVSSCPIKDIILGGGGFMATNSMLFIKKYIDDIPEWVKNAPIGDLPLMLLLSTKGNCCYINDIMSVYRVESVGSWSAVMKNKEKSKVHRYKILKMWDDFDRWTNFKYHRLILKKIKINKYNYAKGYFINLLKKI